MYILENGGDFIPPFCHIIYFIFLENLFIISTKSVILISHQFCKKRGEFIYESNWNSS